MKRVVCLCILCMIVSLCMLPALAHEVSDHDADALMRYEPCIFCGQASYSIRYIYSRHMWPGMDEYFQVYYCSHCGASPVDTVYSACSSVCSSYTGR